MPGTALGPGGSHPRGQPGLSRAPACTPQYPKSRWEVWAGKARNEGGGFQRRVFAVATEADGDEKAGRRPFFYGAVLLRYLVKDREDSVPNPALSGANKGRGFRPKSGISRG